MAGLINGQWSDLKRVPSSDAARFTNWVTVGGEPGPTGAGGFRADHGRYLLYLAWGCPNCHRVAIARSLLDVQSYFDIVWVKDIKRYNGWEIELGVDYLFGTTSLQAVMVEAEGAITAACTVPLLADKKSRRLVSNESDDIVRMMYGIAQKKSLSTHDLWPDELVDEIDSFNRNFRFSVASGVYDILFAESMEAKKRANRIAVKSLEFLEKRLVRNRGIFGDKITASDVWVFPTLLRINTVYAQIFGLSTRTSEFENISSYMNWLWEYPEFRVASDLDRIEAHYFGSVIHGPQQTIVPGFGKSPRVVDRHIFTN